MRLISVVPLVLPLLASAQQQIPLVEGAKNLLAQAQAYLSGGANVAANAGNIAAKVASGASSVASGASTVVSSASNVASDAAANAAFPVYSSVANAAVHDLTMNNWKQTLVHSGSAKPGDASEPWFLLLTGGNKTCNGLCDNLNAAWNEAATKLAADPSGPHLARLDCDDEEILCGMWATSVSQVWVFQVPHPLPSQSTAPTPLSIFYLNFTNVTADEITSIHTEKKYLTQEKYEGAWHPFDGWLNSTGIAYPLAWFLWGMAKIPSWLFMIGLSVFSRYFVSKRMPNGTPPFSRTPQVAPAAGGPRAAAAPAGRRR